MIPTPSTRTLVLIFTLMLVVAFVGNCWATSRVDASETPAGRVVYEDGSGFNPNTGRFFCIIPRGTGGEQTGTFGCTRTIDEGGGPAWAVVYVENQCYNWPDITDQQNANCPT